MRHSYRHLQRGIIAAVAMALSPVFAAAQRSDSVTVRRDSSREASRDSSRVTVLGAMRVEGRVDGLTGVAQSASQGRVSRADLRLRPLTREGEVLENVPGMLLTQHSGDGKANQMFVRGLNLDHGTDFQTRVESMPINMPTHAHGQGYSDLNLLIPEFVDHLEYKLGPYYAELGDFGSAGGATLHLARSLSVPIAKAEAGAWGFARTVLGGSAQIGRNTLLLGGEAKRYDGPWDNAQALRKLSGLARWTWRGARDEVSLLGLAYTNRWNASDQVPSRAVTSGTITAFGQVDSTLGGTTDRHSLSLSWRRALQRGVLRVDAYAMRYSLNLYSNFTYFLDNAPAGDQIEQVDHRNVAGVDLEYTRAAQLLGANHAIRLGLQGRFDDISVGLHGTSRRVRSRTVRADDVRELSTGLWASVESRWRSSFRTLLGVRADGYSFHVASDSPQNSGRRAAAIASPKASLIFGPFSNAEFYLGGGLGFHSNDARGSTITIDPITGESVSKVDPLVRSRGGEIGVRTATTSGLRTSASLWVLDLDSELLFVGDAGTTEPQGRSRRAGVTVASFWRPMSRVTLDGDVSFTHSRFADAKKDAQYVTGALENVVAAGISWEPISNGPTAALRVRHMSGFPLIEDNSVRGTPSTLLNGTVGMVRGRGRLAVSVFNLLGANARDIQYYYASRLAGEPAAGVNDVHFHPAEPRQVRVAFSFGM